MVGYKLKYVLNPKLQEEGAKELRNCIFISLQIGDLWGPLLLCLLLALTLSVSSSQGADVMFGTIFVIIWAGAVIITINAKLLRGKMFEFANELAPFFSRFAFSDTASFPLTSLLLLSAHLKESCLCS